jgi:hypothetical protein
MKTTSLRLSIILLCLLHLFLGTNGVIGGILLMIRTDGSMLGMQSDWLSHSPFKDYFIPGVLLFLFLGIIPLMTFLGLVKSRNWRVPNLFNIYRNRNWAWSFSLYTGIIAITWITIQLIMTQYFWIQPVIIFNGLLIIIMTMLPEIMKRFELND